MGFENKYELSVIEGPFSVFEFFLRQKKQNNELPCWRKVLNLLKEQDGGVGFHYEKQG